MFKKLISLTNLDVKKMLKYGTVATISMISIVYFFGMTNGMLAFPIALTAISLSFEDIHVKTISKTFKLIIIDSAIITASFLASINPYIGIPINFLTIFLIAYFLTVKFNPKIYKPFMMLFVFTSFSPVSFEDYITRIASMLFGIILVMGLTFITSRKTKKNIIIHTIYKPLQIFNEYIKTIIDGNKDYRIYKNFSKTMRTLCYKIYITRYRNFLTTNIGKIQFDIYLSLEKLNIYIDTISKEKDLSNDKTLISLHEKINSILDSLNNELDISKITNELDLFAKSNINNKNLPDISEIVECLSYSIKNINTLNLKDLNKPYTSWNRSELEKLFVLIPSDFNLNSIRVRFSLRISISLTIIIFLGHIISIYKFIWVGITIMSVMQPYYEETLTKGKDRAKGNIIGVTIIVLLLHFSKDPYLAFIVLIISLYLTYGFSEYYKLSIFTSMASISVASLSTGLKEITLSRIAFIIIGLIIVFIFNKFVFPYNAEKGAKTLTAKLLKYNLFLFNEYKKLKTPNEKFNPNRFRDIVILTTLNAEKLISRNDMIKSDKINEIVDMNNNLTINMAFDTLAREFKN
ncbi:FUSC family protein [Clostridium thermobutyricum]|uniref:FUSC family protein n=1 Tax=Clostridium thermobutyricum TaxID=29372 RepID=UPI003F524224